MKVVPNLAETVEVSTVSASNCRGNCWPEGGAVTTPRGEGRRADMHDGRARYDAVTAPVIVAAWIGAWWRIAAVYGLAPPWLDGRG